MHLHNIYSKLQHARNLLLQIHLSSAVSVDVRVPLAELDDVIRDIERELIDVASFPLICSCEKKGTAQEHKQTTRRAAEQAYANFRRYSAVHTLSDIENTGGFDCVEIRALLFGLNPFSLKDAKKFSLEHPDIKVDTNGT